MLFLIFWQTISITMNINILCWFNWRLCIDKLAIDFLTAIYCMCAFNVFISRFNWKKKIYILLFFPTRQLADSWIKQCLIRMIRYSTRPYSYMWITLKVARSMTWSWVVNSSRSLFHIIVINYYGAGAGWEYDSILYFWYISIFVFTCVHFFDAFAQSLQ